MSDYHKDIEKKISEFDLEHRSMYHYLLEMNIKTMREKEEYSEEYIEEITYHQTVDVMKSKNKE